MLKGEALGRFAAEEDAGGGFMLRVSEIPGAGIGCFSLRHVRAQAQISPGETEKFCRLQQAEIPDAYLKYCVLLDSGEYLAPQNFMRMGVFWFVNHAREPNVRFAGGRLFALKDLAPDDELTLYYSDLLTHPKNRLWVRSDHI